MQKELASKARTRLFPLILAVIFLVNPNIRLVDIFPDFIACFIIAKYLEYASYRSPFFDEARRSFNKLGIIGLLKIPASAIITIARSGNVSDYDIIVLFTFTFAVVETIVCIGAISNLFSALFYLGERSDNSALISAFNLSKSKKTTPEALKLLLIIFTVVKSLGCALPEMCLLTRSVDTGSNIKVFRPQALYPYAVALALVVVIILGIVAASRTIKYLRAITASGNMREALDGMIDEHRLEELERRVKLGSIKSALTVITVATIFTIELRFDNFNHVNLLPGFLFGAVMLIGLYKLSSHIGLRRPAMISGAVFSAVSVARWFIEINFLDNYGYDALVKSDAAKDAYVDVIIGASVEFLAYLVFISLITVMLVRFADIHTGLSVDNEKFSRMDMEFKHKMRTKICIFGIISAICGVSKLIWVILKYNASRMIVATDDGIEGIGGLDSIDGISAITMTSLPWFGVALLAVSILFIGYTIYLFSEIKEEVELKYS